jgi:hypothetical protein
VSGHLEKKLEAEMSNGPKDPDGQCSFSRQVVGMDEELRPRDILKVLHNNEGTASSRTLCSHFILSFTIHTSSYPPGLIFKGPLSWAEIFLVRVLLYTFFLFPSACILLIGIY